MGMCSRLKGYTKHNERIADLFSLLAIVLLFASIWASLQYYVPIGNWISNDMVLHLPLAVLVMVVDVFLIFALLNIGSSRFSEDGAEERCFHTFKGRRTGSGSLFTAFGSWVQHMEHVNKKHR